MSVVFHIRTFASLVEDLEERGTWKRTLSPDEAKTASDILQRTSTLLADIGLNPDRKYSVTEIDRLKTAIEWALGGGQ